VLDIVKINIFRVLDIVNINYILTECCIMYIMYIYIANTMLMYNIELMDYWINVNITYYLNIFLRSLDIVHVYLI
jgi:hypothetical protein